MISEKWLAVRRELLIILVELHGGGLLAKLLQMVDILVWN
jgi:hypothetical protein